MSDQPDIDFGVALPPLAKRPTVNGYARRPGSGPKGEACRTCQHATAYNYHDRRYFKCWLVKPTHGPGTDIRLKSPACELWKG
jgi:hypothetical protein